MCIPKPAVPAPQPSLVPSLQAATALDLGGSGNRGAAGLGRLALRLGSPSSAAPVQPGVAAAPAVPPVTQAAAPSSPTAASTAVSVPAFNVGGLLGQRLGSLGGPNGFTR